MKKLEYQQEAPWKGALNVIRKLQDKGFIAYLAGGAVRDILLERNPVDYDIATDAVPDEVLALFEHSVLVGKSFGVVRVCQDESWYEIASFRSESEYSDGRHPDSVSFTDARTDARRRDFTVNAVFYDPISDEFHDYCDGIADAQAGILRSVGDPSKRFDEDHLRLLRAVRFSFSLGLKIHRETDLAIRKHAQQISLISSERIRQELTRILTESERAGDAVMYMFETGLLTSILPEVAALHAVEQPPNYHPEGDVLIHTVNMLNCVSGPSPILAFSLLLHDIGKPQKQTIRDGRIRFIGHAEAGGEMAEVILSRLRFSKKDAEMIAHCVRSHSLVAIASEMRDSKVRRLLAEPTFLIELELHRLDRLCASGEMSNYEFLLEYSRRFKDKEPLPPPLLTGSDLIKCGIAQGPEIGKLLDQAYEFQLENPGITKQELMDRIR